MSLLPCAQEVCTLRSIQVPTIMSESGRALASHHAVMVIDVLTRCGSALDRLALPGGCGCASCFRFLGQTLTSALP